MFREMIRQDPATNLLQLIVAMVLIGGFMLWQRRRSRARFEAAVARKQSEHEGSDPAE